MHKAPWLDYGNSLLHGFPETQLKRLRQIHHQAARLITRTKRRDNIKPVLKSLHWLPIEYRAKFKILCQVFKCLNGQGPKYLSDLIISYDPNRLLRSSYKNLLAVPDYNLKTVGPRAFSICGPVLWNGIPDYIKESKSIQSFKSSLKTYYFRQAYQ